MSAIDYSNFGSEKLQSVDTSSPGVRQVEESLSDAIRIMISFLSCLQAGAAPQHLAMMYKRQGGDIINLSYRTKAWNLK
ncbi:hypothetical protein BGZ74_005104 [Mortierella antarctica]|nr:hypothetical protein BGZ74_005104 [Mortierella antarctica]